MPSTYSQYINKEYLSTVLEIMKQKMIGAATNGMATSAATTSAATTSAATTSAATTSAATTSATGTATTSETTASIPFGEIIVGVGYVLLILVFVTRVFFKTLNRFTTYYSSSSSYYSVSQNRGDGPYNRFGFMINADSDSESDWDDDDEVEKNMLSPRVQHLCQQTPPQSPPPPLRRSKRLQMKSLTILEKMLEKQTQTHPYSSSSSSKVLFPPISSDPLPLPSRRSHSLHPEHDEELAFEINRRYEKRMQKRSECNSPLVVRRLIL
jgi:hypothetical protein